MFTGVVEVGLFCNMAEAAYFGMEVSQNLGSSNNWATTLINRMARS
jgi:hypothetical protein